MEYHPTPTLPTLIAIVQNILIHPMNDKLSRFKTYGKRRSLRLEGWDYSLPAIYHATFSTHDRHRVFRNPHACERVVEALRHQMARTHYTVYAFCIMPDHVHELCQPEGEQPVSLITFIQHTKRESARRLHQAGVTGSIWQRGFYDHILRKEEDLGVVMGYIIANPVRAGLTEDYTQYPYSYAQGIKSYGIMTDT